MQRTPHATCTAGFRATVARPADQARRLQPGRQAIRARRKAPFAVFVRALPGAHNVSARVTFKDATRAKTLRSATAPARRRRCSPRPARRSSPDEARRPHPAAPSALRRVAGAARPSPAAVARRPRRSVRRDPAARGPAARPRRPRRRQHAGARRSSRSPRVRPLTQVRTVSPSWAPSRARTATAGCTSACPGRPSGHTGWILADQTIRSSTEWRLVVTSLDPHASPSSATACSCATLLRRRAARPRRRRRTASSSSRRPSRSRRTDAGGPFALATSARSNIFQEFEGGPGPDRASTAPTTSPSRSAARPRTAASGSAPSAITWLAKRIGAGVPVTVKR